MMEKLEPVSSWLKNSWAIYIRRLPTFITIAVLPSIMFMAGTALIALSPSTIILGVAVFIAGIIFSFYSQLALILSLKDNTNAIVSYRLAFRAKILSYSWIAILLLFINFGGFLMGIIPVIIFSIWFMFMPFIFIFEDGRGLNALLKSKEYARGYWWPLFGRFVLMVSIPLFIYFMIYMMHPANPQLISSIINVFSGPFIVASHFLIYRNVVALKPQVITMTSFPRRKFFIFVAWLPLVAMLALPLIGMLLFIIKY